ncbi:MAG: lipoyl(octanoyl) transferase LipB [Chitinophagales bacterium]|nr:lipoyl(octanoyl) transferase LipB [Chitinophagales bacterium]
MIWHDIGLKPYDEVLQLQEKLFHENISAKESGADTQQHVILCEHYPVFTLGKSGKRENILVSDEELNAAYYHVNRGGDVTFHGPGQLVIYPILDVEKLGIGLAEYVNRLEETIIDTLNFYKIKTERLAGAPGIWILNAEPRKIAAIGIKASRGITMHGAAININTDLSYFTKIVPCGLQDKAVTSLQQERAEKADMREFIAQYKKSFHKVFGL